MSHKFFPTLRNFWVVANFFQFSKNGHIYAKKCHLLFAGVKQKIDNTKRLAIELLLCLIETKFRNWKIPNRSNVPGVAVRKNSVAYCIRSDRRKSYNGNVDDKRIQSWGGNAIVNVKSAWDFSELSPSFGLFTFTTPALPIYLSGSFSQNILKK